MTPTILVVDDEPDLELLLTQKFRRQIRKGEFKFLFAHDGQQALDVLDGEEQVDMVLSDINMPRMDGLTLLQRMREFHDDLAAVIVSAYGDMTNIRTAMNRGAFDFLTKPIEFDDLEATVRKTLDHMATLRKLQRERTEAEKARSTLARYFSPSIAEALQNNPNFLDAGGERRVASFLFTDLADFTSLVESSELTIIMPLLNEYLEGVANIIFSHDGTVAKIVGDAVHAMFGAPLDQPDHAKRAVECALAIDRFASDFMTSKNAEGIPIGETRIGVNSGPAIIGNFGGEAFFEYTAYGDVITVAARLESVNKHLGTRICVSDTTVGMIDGFLGRPAGALQLKGKSETLKAYEPLSQERHADPSTAAYMEAYAKMESEAPDARQAFAALVGMVDEDPLANFHLARLLGGETGARIVLAEK